MAGRKPRVMKADGAGSGTTDVPEAVKPSQISSISIVGGAPEMAKGAGVIDYLLAYMGREVEFYNPLTGATETREAAEVIALQMVIGALHGDKSAINRLIERTEGKVGVGVGAARASGKAGVDDPRSIAMAAERERQSAIEAAGSSPNPIRYEMPVQPLQIFPTPRTGDETIM